MKLLNLDPTRALVLYAGLVTMALLWIMLTGATAQHSAEFDTITVHRINVKENDGKLRLIIASRDHFPGTFYHGKEIKRPDRSAAGMLFLNDESTENGGLYFSGRKVNGKIVSGGHLSFDQYEQDQVVNLEQTDENGEHYGGLTIADYPDQPLPFDLPARLKKLPADQRQSELDRLEATGVLGHARLFVGKSQDRDALLSLRDGEGRPRLRLRVTEAGAASIEFLDEEGKVVRIVK